MSERLELRIIAGEFGGRIIDSPKKSTTTRPTLERVREALFDILARKIPESRVLDLCAGTGALGLEAISRGARHVTFIEGDRRNVRLIQENIDKLGVAAKAKVVSGNLPDAFRKVKGLFDFVLFDPPYHSELEADTLTDLAYTKLLASGATVILERDRRARELEVEDFSISRRHRIGDTELWFLAPLVSAKKNNEDQNEGQDE